MRIFSFAMLIAASAVILPALPAFGQDAPQRKSGLWEIKTSSSAAADEARIIQICVDQKADDITGQAASAKKMCSKADLQRTGDRLTVDSVCKFGGTTATTHSVITGKFDSAYRVETSSTYDPPLSGMKQTSATIDARWLGPCTADQKPGDMILGNGLKININDTKGMKTPKAKE